MAVIKKIKMVNGDIYEIRDKDAIHSLNNAELTGIPTAPTPDDSTQNTQIATTAYVHNAMNEIIPKVEEDVSTTGYIYEINTGGVINHTLTVSF